MYIFFKTNYIWISLRYVTFQVQVEIGLYIMSPTLEGINRPFMRSWIYTMVIQIEFGSSMQSYASHRHRGESCIWFTYLWIPYKKKKYKEKKIGSINPLKFIKKIESAGESEAWKQVSSSSNQLRYFCMLFTPIHKA